MASFSNEELSRMVRQCISTPELGIVTINYQLLQSLLQSMLDKLELAHECRIKMIEQRLDKDLPELQGNVIKLMSNSSMLKSKTSQLDGLTQTISNAIERESASAIFIAQLPKMSTPEESVIETVGETKHSENIVEKKAKTLSQEKILTEEDSSSYSSSTGTSEDSEDDKESLDYDLETGIPSLGVLKTDVPFVGTEDFVETDPSVYENALQSATSSPQTVRQSASYGEILGSVNGISTIYRETSMLGEDTIDASVIINEPAKSISDSENARNAYKQMNDLLDNLNVRVAHLEVLSKSSVSGEKTGSLVERDEFAYDVEELEEGDDSDDSEFPRSEDSMIAQLTTKSLQKFKKPSGISDEEHGTRLKVLVSSVLQDIDAAESDFAQILDTERKSEENQVSPGYISKAEKSSERSERKRQGDLPQLNYHEFQSTDFYEITDSPRTSKLNDLEDRIKNLGLIPRTSSPREEQLEEFENFKDEQNEIDSRLCRVEKGLNVANVIRQNITSDVEQIFSRLDNFDKRLERFDGRLKSFDLSRQQLEESMNRYVTKVHLTTIGDVLDSQWDKKLDDVQDDWQSELTEVKNYTIETADNQVKQHIGKRMEHFHQEASEGDDCHAGDQSAATTSMWLPKVYCLACTRVVGGITTCEHYPGCSEMLRPKIPTAKHKESSQSIHGKSTLRKDVCFKKPKPAFT